MHELMQHCEPLLSSHVELLASQLNHLAARLIKYNNQSQAAESKASKPCPAVAVGHTGKPTNWEDRDGGGGAGMI